MAPGEWIALVAVVVTVCLTIGGSAAAIIAKISSLDTSVRMMGDTFSKFEKSVERTHRDMWAAINERHRREGESE